MANVHIKRPAIEVSQLRRRKKYQATKHIAHGKYLLGLARRLSRGLPFPMHSAMF